jgi:hypothetical protein
MSRSRLRRGDRNAVRLACAMTMVLPLAALWSAAHAKADPRDDVDLYAAQNGPKICAVLDAFPTFDGIGGVSDAIVNNSNLTYRDAGEAIADAVFTVCPQHVGLIKQFISAYAPMGPAVLR